MLDDLNETYNISNSISGYQVISIGTIWKDFIAGNIIILHEGDNIYPNLNGSYLTAAICFRKLFNVNSIID